MLRNTALVALFIFASANTGHPASVPVKHIQGATRGFLTVRSEGGAFLASGELTQTATGNRVTSKLVFTFRDGSLDEETVTYSQAGSFKLIRDHHIQRGPFFTQPLDMLVDATTGTVTMRSMEKDGNVKETSEHMDLPGDVCNGMVGTMLLNLPSNSSSLNLGMVAPTGKGRLVKLAVSPSSDATFRIAGTTKKASVYRLHVELGGVTGVVAPLIGKEPKDIFVSVLRGDAPALVRMVGQLCEGGPVVSIELAGATFAGGEK